MKKTVTDNRRTTTKRAAPRDPVTRYAQRVHDGKILAGRAVRLACERHLRDLDRQRTRAFPYYFSVSAAQHVIDFFPEFCTLESGQAFELIAWQQFCLGSLFGWKRLEDDGRRFQTAYIETGKGSGKTPMLAGVGLYALVFDDEQAAEVYSAAFDKGQASLILNDAIRMAGASPELAELLDIGKYNIAHPDSRSFFRAVSSEHRSKSGPRPSMVLVDELHEHRDATVVNKMVAGFKFRRQPLNLEITNSGVDRTSICWNHHEKSLQVLERVHDDEQWFAYVCQLDPCDTCYREGYRQPKDGCADCDDWTDERVWLKANPSLGMTIQPSYLRNQVNGAVSMPSEQGLVKRLNFCLWTESHRVWIPSDQWLACTVPEVGTSLEGACAAGFDMSMKLDLTACVIALRVEDDDDTPTETVELTEIDNGQEVKKVFNLNFTVELIPYFWLPEETLLERVSKEHIPYDVWRADGHLRVSPGPVIDYDQIYDDFKLEIGPKFKPQRVAYDPYNATQFALQLRDKAKYTVVEMGQGRKLSESFKLFEALVRMKRIRHAGNPVMGFCVANAEPRFDRHENLWIEKPSQTKRIDGLIAAVMALNQLMLLPARRPGPRRRPRVWTPTGWKEAGTDAQPTA